nr:WAS/WASL-interacting protein family member 3-like [Globicephala melas]
MRVQGSGEEGAAATRLLRFPWSTADPSRLSGGGQRVSGLAEMREGRGERRGAKRGKLRGGGSRNRDEDRLPLRKANPKWRRERRRQSGGGGSSLGGRERRAPRAPPPPTPPSSRFPPSSSPLTRPGRRSAHGRPHAPECIWARRSLLPPTTAFGRLARPPASTHSLWGASSHSPPLPLGPCQASSTAGPHAYLRQREPKPPPPPPLLSSPLPRPHCHQPPPLPPPPPPPPAPPPQTLHPSRVRLPQSPRGTVPFLSAAEAGEKTTGEDGRDCR